MEEIRDGILKDQLGYKISGYEEEKTEGRLHTAVVIVEPNPSNKNKGAKAWFYAENKYNAGLLFFAIIETPPSDWNLLKKTFQEITKPERFVVVPPEK